MNTQRSQNINFLFSSENLEKAHEILMKYPLNKKQSAIMPLLYLAQEQNNGWISIAIMDYIANFIDLPPIKVYEIAHFYSMYNKAPVGKHSIQICRAMPCWLRGSAEVQDACQEFLGIGLDETTNDGNFTLKEVECIGACVNAPAIQINNDFYENLDREKIIDLLNSLKKNAK